MFRNQYDNDTTTWSPQGRLHQVEYALEAVKQGSAAVGLISKTHSVIVALKRNSEDLGSYQKKIIRIDDHLAIALAGLAPDARVLSNSMRTQSMSSKMIYDRPIPIIRIADTLAEKAQRRTQLYGQRPYGVGLLLIGCDVRSFVCDRRESLLDTRRLGRIYSSSNPQAKCLNTELLPLEQDPNLHEHIWKEMSIVLRTVCCALWILSELVASREELILHGLRALRDTLPQEKELTSANTTIGIVGVDEKFKLMDDEHVVEWLTTLGETMNRRKTAVAAQDVPAPEAMETD
ncbi:putative proteasome subunit alpha type-6 [Neolecta irregularis DAH-3]|uniref:Proteasome subunit alpha type n=1 Tax=Neolecta irregularis (strain DAH-3) TaxID=1198029 RepID=A0A1U7LK90_NEOID|nr:putative proteasome subunit alpha type-6 [Neolecta irregularis DAH-3]|eukprot:OLL23075.1 putative proteasome subunit alpha type-6 [Neolecta irregularis DAH-3]